MCKRRLRLRASDRQSPRQSFAAASARIWRLQSAKGPPQKTEESKMALNLTEVASAQMQDAPASVITAIAEHLRRTSVQVDDGRASRGGTGVIWETDATRSVIITNAHVVKGRRARVTLRDGQTAEGRVTSLDGRRDLAALTIDVGDLPVATIGDSDI